jgi:(5-formylfuran-3-yl)methyl phosphate synthase
MTLERRHVRFLASVTNESEAKLAGACGADIIDCKDPSKGALGALPGEVVRAVRRLVPRHIPVSATIGDLPAEPEPVLAAVRAMAATGVDYVKIGFFAGGDARTTIERLGELSLDGVRLVGVLLADRKPDYSLIADMQRTKFFGVMLDTAGKDGRTLRDHMSASELRAFVQKARSAGLLAGLAGSLRLSDIPDLSPLEPDILGFRGALCAARRREAALDAAAVRAVRHAISAQQASPSAELEPSL